MFWKSKSKEKIKELEAKIDKLEGQLKHPNNIYTVINSELARVHHRFATTSGEQNLNVFWNRIKEIQDKVIDTLEKQPHSDYELRKLQDQIADLYLTGENDEG